MCCLYSHESILDYFKCPTGTLFKRLCKCSRTFSWRSIEVYIWVLIFHLFIVTKGCTLVYIEQTFATPGLSKTYNFWKPSLQRHQKAIHNHYQTFHVGQYLGFSSADVSSLVNLKTILFWIRVEEFDYRSVSYFYLVRVSITISVCPEIKTYDLVFYRLMCIIW